MNSASTIFTMDLFKHHWKKRRLTKSPYLDRAYYNSDNWLLHCSSIRKSKISRNFYLYSGIPGLYFTGNPGGICFRNGIQKSASNCRRDRFDSYCACLWIFTVAIWRNRISQSYGDHIWRSSVSDVYHYSC